MCLTQPAPSAQTPTQPAPAAAVPTSATPTPVAKTATPTPNPAPAPEPETDADKFVRAAADQIDKIEHVDGKIRQTVKVSERKIESKGLYQRGPGYRCRFELDIDLGDATGKRLIVCDGQTGYLYRKVLEVEELQMIQLAKVLDLLKKKDLPSQNRRRVLSQLPVVEPGDMLRGYLGTVTFTKVTDKTIGEPRRKVKVVEGQWRKRAVESLVGRQGVTDLESLGGNMPQYVRLYLDAETSWPLKIELFRRDKEAEWKPVFTLEFPDVVLGRPVPEAQFHYTPPKKPIAQDVTSDWVNFLQAIKDKPSAPGKATPPSAGGAVSKPIERPASPKTPEKK